MSYRTIQSLRHRVASSFLIGYGLEWLGVICTTEPIKDFFFFFFSRKETLLTLLNEYTKIFTNLFLLFLAEIPYGKDHYQTFLHLTVVKILVQLTLLISKTRFWVWVLDWSVRHILFFFKMCLTHTHTMCVGVCARACVRHISFCARIIGLFHYHFINNGSCHVIIVHLGLSKWVQSYVVTLFFKCKNTSAKRNYSSYPPTKRVPPIMNSKRVPHPV